MASGFRGMVLDGPAQRRWRVVGGGGVAGLVRWRMSSGWGLGIGVVRKGLGKAAMQEVG